VKTLPRKHKQLKPDGSYGEDISAYSLEGEICKAKFLQDAKALLNEVAWHLREYGLAKCEISVNPGGIAGSGDVSAHCWNPEEPTTMVYCTIGSSSLGHGRKDGLIILARQEEAVIEDKKKNKRGWRTGSMGPNQWIDPAHNSLELAGALLDVLGMAREADKLLHVAYHSLTAGIVPCPSLLVSSPQDAMNWQAQQGALQASMAADAHQHAEAGQEQLLVTDNVKMALPL
jgi:hypothetical protein